MHLIGFFGIGIVIGFLLFVLIPHLLGKDKEEE